MRLHAPGTDTRVPVARLEGGHCKGIGLVGTREVDPTALGRTVQASLGMGSETREDQRSNGADWDLVRPVQVA